MRRAIIPGAVAALLTVLLAGCAHGPGKVPPEHKLYQRARDALTVENYKRATTQFRQLLSTYPFGKYATQARLDLMYAYYRNNQPDEAAKQADDFAKENPASPYVAYALFLKGVAYANAMQTGPISGLLNQSLNDRDPIDQQKAYTAFQQLVKRYPHTEYARQSKQWMVFVRNRLAGFNLNVARFYARRRQWVAAVDRATKIVTAFPGTPMVKPALKIMVRGYHALGEDDLADAAQKWYQFNFAPNAPAQASSAAAGNTRSQP